LLGRPRQLALKFFKLGVTTAIRYARACRALAYHDEQAAKRMENPAMRGPIESTAKRPAALTEKFAEARKKH
jgi:hypothetical protein